MTDRHRHTLFTSFANVAPLFTDQMKYLVCGAEVCPSTKKAHWQCHVWWKTQVSFKQACERLNGCHCEISKDPLASIKYCKKENCFMEFGESPRQGARNDLVHMKNRILSGETTVDDIIIDDPVMIHMYGRTLDRIQHIANKKVKRDWEMKCYWLYGPTGVGKTRYVMEEEKSVYMYPYDGRWWDSYQGEECILFDDFRGQVPMNELLRLCDRYTYNVAKRGQSPYPMVSKKVYFTSCCRMADCYKDPGDSLSQLERRVKSVYFDGMEKPVLD